MQQNYAVMFLLWMGRLVGDGKLQISPVNPLVVELDAIASGHFLLGRDVENQPFLGIPIQFMPFFTQIDWMEISLCREEGRLYLEARDSETQALHMALSLSIREERLNVICLKGVENPASLMFGMRVFSQNPQNPKEILVADQNEISGFPIKEVNNILDIGTEMEIESALRLYEKTGMGSVFSITDTDYI